MAVGKLPSPACWLGMIAVLILMNDSLMLLWEYRRVCPHSCAFWRIKAFTSVFFYFTWISIWLSAAPSEYQTSFKVTRSGTPKLHTTGECKTHLLHNRNVTRSNLDPDTDHLGR